MIRTLTRKIGVLFFVPVCGALISAVFFFLFLQQTVHDPHIINVAGRQRMLSQQFLIYSHMVYLGQEEGRDELRQTITAFGETLLALEQGGKVMEYYLPPAPKEILDEIAQVKVLWQEIKERLILIVEQPITAPQMHRAYAFVESRIPLLLKASDKVVFSYELRSNTLRKQIFFVLIFIAGLDLLLLFVGIWITKEYISERIHTEDKLKQDYDIQHILNSLLKLFLKDVTIDEILKSSLDLLLSVRWLTFESRGAIFLVEDEPEVLVMKAQKDLPEPLQKKCVRIPFGQCICGRAALTKKTQFINRLDEKHQIRYEGIRTHGHYCVPIIYADKVLGVINIYVKEEHIYQQNEEEFLQAIADALAGILIRKIAQDKLKEAYEQRKQTELQLVQSAKMASIGLLAAGVAHEINNPLFVITGETEMLLKDESKDRETKDTSRIILEQAGRITEITKRLLDFSRQKESKRQSLDVNKVIEESISLLNYQIKLEKIKIVKDMAVALPMFLGDENQLQEVFLNIMLNAAQSMEGTGILTIRTYSEKITEGERGKINKFKTGDTIVVIEFKDTGKGMDDEALSKIFDPFYTMKEKGTGLGLFICYGIVDNHRGTIEVQSKLGEGSTFIIKLPIP